MPVPDDKVPVLSDVFQNGLLRHAKHSKSKHIEVHEIQFTKKEAGYKLIVTISRNFEKENLQTVLSTIESWIDFILQSKEQKDVSVFYDEERY